MMSERDDTLLSRSLDYLVHDQRELVMDSVYCALSNTARDLEGNTEASDVKWFAAWFYREATGRSTAQYERLDAAEREHWEAQAAAALRVLPELMSRIASRYRTHAKVLRTLAQQERGAKRRVLRQWAARVAEEDRGDDHGQTIRGD
ncbi:MAG TPA: hypothetical protein DCQ64_00410 [Candidatus Rokubacteria bacterium]|nr:hypothetical protein [Candidatus Rokubacteria bacterium]